MEGTEVIVMMEFLIAILGILLHAKQEHMNAADNSTAVKENTIVCQ